MLEKVRKVLEKLNMKDVSRETGIGYETLRAFKTGRQLSLKDEQINKIINYVNSLFL